MNIETIQQHIAHKIQLFQKRLAAGWKTFMFTPARYWTFTLSILTGMLLIIILVDSFLLWNFIIKPHNYSQNREDAELVLERGSLEVALTFLREREQRFTQTRQNGIIIHDIFTPAGVSSTSTTR